MDNGIQGQDGIRVTRYKAHKGNGIKGHNRVNGWKVKYAYMQRGKGTICSQRKGAERQGGAMTKGHKVK